MAVFAIFPQPQVCAGKLEKVSTLGNWMALEYVTIFLQAFHHVDYPNVKKANFII